VTSRMRNFGREDFARFHPAGSLGQKLSKVEHHMRPLPECRVTHDEQTVRQMLVAVSVPGRRSGATMLTDADGRLSGIFTDSDLARLFEHHRDRELDGKISDVMTRDPVTVQLGSLMSDAIGIMAQRKLSELPVVDARGKPLGLIDITDVVSLLPKDGGLGEQGPATSPTTTPWRVFREPEGGAEA